MIELLIALVIVGIMILVLALGQGLQFARGEDARRKSDFARLKVAFEDYYNDKGCYPPPALLQRCGSSDLAPWIAKVPCDPQSRQPYAYYMDSSCKWFALFTTLGDTKDPVITTLDCSPTCGIANFPYNFVQTNGGARVDSIINTINGGGSVSATPTPVPTPTPTPTPVNNTAYACDPLGYCNIYFNPSANGCPVTFQDAATCQAACSTVSNRCTR